MAHPKSNRFSLTPKIYEMRFIGGNIVEQVRYRKLLREETNETENVEPLNNPNFFTEHAFRETEVPGVPGADLAGL